MGLVWKLSFRNLFRNTRRTLLTALVIGVGLAAMMFVDGMVRGMKETMIKTATGTFLGEAQIHHPKFIDAREIDYPIQSAKELRNILDRFSELEAYSTRTIVQGMLSSSSNVAPIALYGIKPDLEARVSKLKLAVRKGEYLSSQNSENQILLGSELADLLEVEIGDRLVVTVSQAATGELSQELFRLSGIFHFNSRSLDQSMAFALQKRVQKMANLHGGIHEFSLKFKKLGLSPESKSAFLKEIESTGNVFRDWRKLVPSLQAMVEWSQYSVMITGFILFGIIALGVMNSIFMSLYERMFEFGVIRAIGTQKWKVFQMIMCENIGLGVLSIWLGLVVGTILLAWFSVHGIDYTDLEFSGVTLQEPIRLIFDVSQFTTIPLSVFFLTLLAGIYPAIHAARILPAEAMKKSL